MLPEGWKLTTVGDVCSIKNNLRLPISSEERDLIQGQFPYFGPTGILGYINHYKIDEEFVLIGEDGDHFLKFKDKEMTLLFSGKANVNNHAHIIANSEHCLAQWFHLFFVHRDITSFLTRQGAKRYKLTKAALEKLPLTLPPLPEQKKIAQILSTWDNAITTTEQLIANSQQQKKALMQQLLTGKKRLLDDSGVRFSGEWEVVHLGDVSVVDSGYAFKSNDFTDDPDGMPVIKMSDFKDGSLDISQAARVAKEVVANLEKFELKLGDFIFGMSGSLSNYAWVKAKDIPSYLNQRVGRITAKNKENQLFITYLYLSDKVQQTILDKAAGAAQLNISVGDLRSMKVEIPSSQVEQQKIAAVLSLADREIEALQSKLTALKQEKKALMQQLLAGKRRVFVHIKENDDV